MKTLDKTLLPRLILATLEDYPTIQNMARFYVYELSRECGFTEEFTRINKNNPKLTKIFFVKFFKNKKQTQGLTL